MVAEGGGGDSCGWRGISQGLKYTLIAAHPMILAAQHNTAQHTRRVSVATAGAKLWGTEHTCRVHTACGITHVSTMTSSCVTFCVSYGMCVYAASVMNTPPHMRSLDCGSNKGGEDSRSTYCCMRLFRKGANQAYLEQQGEGAHEHARHQQGEGQAVVC